MLQTSPNYNSNSVNKAAEPRNICRNAFEKDSKRCRAPKYLILILSYIALSNERNHACECKNYHQYIIQTVKFLITK